MEITYEGIRLTPSEIVAAAADGRAHVVGLSILSGSHVPLVETLMAEMRAAGLGHVPVVVGGIIPEADAKRGGCLPPRAPPRVFLDGWKHEDTPFRTHTPSIRDPYAFRIGVFLAFQMPIVPRAEHQGRSAR